MILLAIAAFFFLWGCRAIGNSSQKQEQQSREELAKQRTSPAHTHIDNSPSNGAIALAIALAIVAAVCITAYLH